MKCTICQYENPEGSRFCGSCGSPLNQICTSCGASNAPSFKFCSSCGHSLKKTNLPVTAAPLSHAPVKQEAERRHLTVMFCDVVGSTALSERLDAEEFRRVIMDYGAVCEKVISHYKGHIAQYLGDGIMVYFGYPNAMEDAPVIGIRCGLAMIEAMEQANEQWLSEGKPAVDIRIGLHTGLTVVDDHMGLGETCNAAARIQDKAEKNTVIISADAHKLVKGWFETKSMGEHLLKGLSKPMEIYLIKGESGARHQMDFRMADDLTPLIGRDKELSLLFNAWEETRNKHDKVVFLSGEAGMGKSRLVHDLKEYARSNSNPLLIECNCSAIFNNSAFNPIVDMLQEVILKINRKESAAGKLSKIEEFLIFNNFNTEENVPLLAGILSIPLAGSKFSSIGISAESQKQKSMELLISILLKLAEKGKTGGNTSSDGVILIFEDLNWADPSTLEFINLIVHLNPQYGILTLLTYRPGFNYDWRHLSHTIQIALTNLNNEESKNIISKITGGKALPQEVLRQIIDKTDGIPLFIEELTKMVLESGLVREENNRYVLSGPLPPLAIPTTLQDSLKARLDRFISAKEVVYWASVIGKDFSYELLEACCPIDKRMLLEYIRELVHSGLLIQKGFPPHAHYRFRHSLMQDAAYESILRSRRLQLHQRIATVLIEKFPEIIAEQPEMLAHHFSEAGLNEQAIPYWQQASEKALRASAYIEALHHIDQGLKMVSTMAESDKRVQYELAFQVRNSTVIKIQDGWSSDKVKKAYDRCFELCKDLGESEELFTTLFGIWAYYLIGGNINQSYEIALGCLERTEQLNNPAIKMQSNLMLGNSLFWLARYDEAIPYLENVFAMDEGSNDNLINIGFGLDTRVVAKMILCWSQVMKGDLEKAYLTNHDSLKLVAELNHPFSEAIARCTACWFFQFTRDVENTFHHAQLAIDLGFPAYQCWGHMLKGWSIAAEGKSRNGIEEIKSGYQLFKDQGCGIETYPSVLLAEAYIMDGDYQNASIHIEQGLKAVENNKEMVFEPELLRLKGIVNSLQRGRLSDSAALIQKAIAIADKNGNELFSFRGALSLQKISNSNGDAPPELLDILESKKKAINVKGYEKFLKREKTFA